jgi:membrane dipeptidase
MPALAGAMASQLYLAHPPFCESVVKRLILTLTGLLILGLIITVTIVPALLEDRMNVVIEHPPWPISEQAQALHAGLVVADLHADTLLWRRDALERANRGHVDIPRLREGNVAIQVFPAVTKSPSGQNYESNSADSDTITLLAMSQLWPVATWNSLYQRALYQAGRMQELQARAPQAIKLVRNRADLAAVLASRKDGSEQIAALLAIEGSHALDGDLENIAGLYTAGYRIMGLHHFFDNQLGGSLHGTSRAGLTDFGRQAVKRMLAQGIIIDVAHSSPASVDEVIELSAGRPFILSHGGVQGLCDSARNLADEQMQRIAAAGGLLGVGFWDAAVCDPHPAKVVNAIRYAIDLMGVEHVALGSDYDGAVTVMFDSSELAVLTGEMLKTDFTEAEIRAVMGGNVARFLLANLPVN